MGSVRISEIRARKQQTSWKPKESRTASRPRKAEPIRTPSRFISGKRSSEELEDICRMPMDTPCSVSVVHKRSKEENCLRTAELFLHAEAYRWEKMPQSLRQDIVSKVSCIFFTLSTENPKRPNPVSMQSWTGTAEQFIYMAASWAARAEAGPEIHSSILFWIASISSSNS